MRRLRLRSLRSGSDYRLFDINLCERRKHLWFERGKHLGLSTGNISGLSTGNISGLSTGNISGLSAGQRANIEPQRHPSRLRPRVLDDRRLLSLSIGSR